MELLRYAVTQVFIAEGSDGDQVRNECEEGGDAVIVGSNWADDVHYVYMCQRRQLLSDLQVANGSVVKRIGVYRASKCPSTTNLLYEPHANLVVCVHFTSAYDPTYVIDLSVSTSRDYNNESPGWMTIPLSVHIDDGASSGDRGVFISYRRPVLPISGLHILQVNSSEEPAEVCQTTLGDVWEQGGDGFLIEEMQVKALLCVQRGGLSAITALSELRVINPDGICSDGYHEVAESLLGIRLCALWGSPASVPFIGDLVLQRFQKSELDGVGPETLQPGNFELLWSQSLTKEADSVVYLFSRQQPQAHLVPDTPGSSKRPLQARSSKKTSLSFKILQLADLHFTGDSNTRCSDPPVGMKPTTCTEALMQSFIHDLLVAEQPDLVVFSGDNVHTSSIELHKAAVDAFTSGVEAMGIPFAIVFGNHDHENGFDKLEILKLVMNKAQSYTERGPTELPGLGNYELAIVAPMDGPWGPKGSEVFRLYLLDSHSNPNVTADPNALPTDYDWIRPQQVEFYRQRAELHRSQNGSLPSVMFFHIPIPEFAAAASKQRYGEHQEAVSSPHVNTNLFSTLVEQNDVKAVFVGHDHLNEYCYLREGIQLCYGGGTGLGRAYGDENFARRARVIEWTMDAKQQRTLTTWKRHFGSVHSVRNVQVLFTEDPSLASSSVMMEWYVFLPAIVTFVCISLLCGRHCWHKRRRQQKKMRDTAMHMVVATD